MAESSVASLIGKLSDPGESDRLFAVQDLGHTKSEQAIKPLIQCLQKETSLAVKEAVRTALLLIPSTSVIRELTTLLGSDDVFERNMAIQILRKRGQEEDALLWEIFTTERDANVRKFIVDIVTEFDRARSAPFFEKALKDSDPNVIIAAIEGIVLSDLADFKADLEAIFTSSREPMLISACLDAFLQIGKADSLSLVMKKFGSLESVTRPHLHNILKLIGQFAEPDMFGELESFAQGKPQWHQAILLHSILPIYSRNPLEKIPPNLLVAIRDCTEKNPCDNEQGLIFSFLASRIDELCIRELVFDFLGSADTRIRKSALYLCANVSDEDIKKKLMERLTKEQDPALREIIKNALG